LHFAFERLLEPAIGRTSDQHLEVTVVYTAIPETLAALRRAAILAGSLNARIKLLVPQVVPYPLPLTSPPVLIDFNERRFLVVARQMPVETTARIYLCRDRMDALTTVLRPNSVVVIGARRSWWFGEARRLARRLERAGHEVILADMERDANG
jgi:hypothetical protein